MDNSVVWHNILKWAIGSMIDWTVFRT